MDMLSPLGIIYIKKLLGYLYCLRWQVERFLYKSFLNPLYIISPSLIIVIGLKESSGTL